MQVCMCACLWSNGVHLITGPWSCPQTAFPFAQDESLYAGLRTGSLAGFPPTPVPNNTHLSHISSNNSKTSIFTTQIVVYKDSSSISIFLYQHGKINALNHLP